MPITTKVGLHQTRTIQTVVQYAKNSPWRAFTSLLRSCSVRLNIVMIGLIIKHLAYTKMLRMRLVEIFMGYLTIVVSWGFKWSTRSNLWLFVVMQRGAGLSET
uniref:Uncharacterized protein n=1 Tax=mine drainage metagenome TaxID=410659 RepID=E6QCR4_9ZZZZ